MSKNRWTITISNVPPRLASEVLVPFASSKRLTRLVIALLEGYQNDEGVRAYVEKALGANTEPSVEASAPAVSNIEQLEAELADIRAWMTTLVAQGGLVPTVDADTVEPVEEEPAVEPREEAPVETVGPTLPPVEETVDTDGYNIDIDLEDADAMDSFFAGLDSFE